MNDLLEHLSGLPLDEEGFHKAVNVLHAEAGELSAMAVRFTAADSEWGRDLSLDEIDTMKAQNTRIRLVLHNLETRSIEMHRMALDRKARQGAA